MLTSAVSVLTLKNKIKTKLAFIKKENKKTLNGKYYKLNIFNLGIKAAFVMLHLKNYKMLILFLLQLFVKKLLLTFKFFLNRFAFFLLHMNSA